MAATDIGGGASLHRLEMLVWTILRSFEVQGRREYQRNAAYLLSDEKVSFVARLCSLAPSDEPLDASELSEPVRALLVSASGEDETATLMVRGLLLEGLGKTIYDLLSRSSKLSAQSRALAAHGGGVSARVMESVASRLSASTPDGEALFAAFAAATRVFLNRLDESGEAFDRVFADEMDLRFADIMGDLVADLVPFCLELGMNRRKVVCHLTGALMGI